MRKNGLRTSGLNLAHKGPCIIIIIIIIIMIIIMFSSRLCSKKNWSEPSALNLSNPVCPAYMISMKKQRFSSCTRKKKLGAVAHWALLEHSLAYIRLGRGNKYLPT